jgi:spermidine synthase
VASVTVERLVTPRGELVLRRESGPAGEHYEIVSNGVFLADTRDGRSERELARAALSGAPDRARVLIGGLGVGFSLAEVLRGPAVGHVTVVEVEPAVVRWHRGPLAPYSAGGLDDPRVDVVVADLVDFVSTGDSRFDAVCLDVDNGPEWTVTDSNAALYTEGGLDCVDRRLAPGGTLAVWSAGAAPTFEARLRSRYAGVDVIEIPVPRGEPDVVYVARGR